ncbi:MAG: NEW3 domain-containing protein [Candidatus Bathyarchaeota archaeon]|nr:NEW3 domain-containing protein [Candidatus Bathyarchaeota archaeon]
MNRRTGAIVLILMAFLLSSPISAWIFAVPAGSGNVHGTVLDEKGEPVFNVKVMAYSDSGNLASTLYTDEDGYFRFAIENPGQYTIYFEKDGYSGDQTSINLPAGLFLDEENDPIKMGEIVLLQNLRLDTSVLSRVVSRGETASFPFTVGILDESEVTAFSVVGPEGWDIRVLDSMGEIGRVQLSSGDLSLTLEVGVPENAIEIGSVNLTLIGSLNTSLIFLVQPTPLSQSEIELASTYPYITEELGNAVNFAVMATNTGEADETVEFSIDAPEGWETSFITGSGMEVLSLFLESGDSEALSFEVQPSPTADVGVYELEILMVSDNGVIWDSLVLKVSLKESEGEVDLRSSFTDVTVEAGTVIHYALTIRNKGDIDDLFILTVLSAPETWDAVFMSETVEVSSLLISAGSYSNLVFEVISPDDYEPGSYSLMVLVESEGGSVGDTLALGVELKESFSDIEILSTFTDVTVEAGNTITYPLQVENNGDNDDQLTMNVVSAPDNWDAVFMSGSIEVSSFYLPVDDFEHLNLVVEPPSNTETGDYALVIQAESAEGALSEKIELKATVVGSHDVELELSTLFTTITIGDSVEFNVEVTNAGLSPLTFLHLETTVPADWGVTVSPSQLASLAPMTSVIFTLSAETPSDTVAGDYIVTVQALSDQAESEEADLRLTAQASTSWGFLGLGLAIIAVIGLAIVFTRFKRR